MCAFRRKNVPYITMIYHVEVKSYMAESSYKEDDFWFLRKNYNTIFAKLVNKLTISDLHLSRIFARFQENQPSRSLTMSITVRVRMLSRSLSFALWRQILLG